MLYHCYSLLMFDVIYDELTVMILPVTFARQYDASNFTDPFDSEYGQQCMRP